MTIDAQISQLGLTVWGNDSPAAEISQIGLTVWARLPKVTTYYVWPFRILKPVKVRAYRIGTAKAGPIAADGAQQQWSRTDGGGIWRMDCSFNIYSIDEVRALRAWSSYLDHGAQAFIMPLIDLHFAPRDLVGGELRKPGPTAAASDYFSEVAAYDTPIVIAEIVQAAALRATSIRVQITQGSAPRGGEHLSINHPTAGWRMYEVGRITAQLSGDIFDMDIRPPLREAVTIGSGNPPVEYDIPRVLMRLHPDTAPQLAAGITNFRVGEQLSVSFIEHFDAG